MICSPMVFLSLNIPVDQIDASVNLNPEAVGAVWITQIKAKL